MGRDPDTVPDDPGGGYDGFLAWPDGGVNAFGSGVRDGYGAYPAGTYFAGPPVPEAGPNWQGLGAQSWYILVNGAEVGVFACQDGMVGPFATAVADSGPVTSTPWSISGFEPVIDIDWSLSTNIVQLVAYYYDRPAFANFWACSPYFTYLGLSHPTGYFDPWVAQHHSVPYAADRNGNDLGFAGPWGAAVPAQTFRDNDPICEPSLTVTDWSLMTNQGYGEVAYPVSCPPQPLAPCIIPSGGVHIAKRWGQI